MTPDDDTIAGWNNTDADVPVRSTSSVPAASMPQHEHHADMGGIVTDHPVDHREVEVREIVTKQAHSRSMGAAAVLGVAIVLLSVALFVGIDSIRGDLTGTTLNVTITQSGTFEPPSVSVEVGQTITITNGNQNPQVLKAADPLRVLFPVQVLFPSTPYTFTIPASAIGAYVYVSETLPADRTLTINVSPATPIPFGETQTSSQQSSVTGEIPIPFGQSSSAHLEIPIPFGIFSSSSTSSSVSSSSSSSVTVSVGGTGGRSTWGGNVCAGGTCYVAGGNYAQPNYTAPAVLPVNPYTVGTTTTNIPQTITTPQGTQKTVVTDGDHQGAAVKELSKHRPDTITDTGPANMLLLIIPALLGVIVMFERRLRMGM